jgi:hypothetical protein
MKSDEFELYAIQRGYHLAEFGTTESTEGVVYSKGEGNKYKCLAFYNKNKYVEGFRIVKYTTTNTAEILKLKSSFLLNGYYLSSSTVDDENHQKFESFYQKGSTGMMLYIITDAPDSEFDFVRYTVRFYKLE